MEQRFRGKEIEEKRHKTSIRRRTHGEVTENTVRVIKRMYIYFFKRREILQKKLDQPP